MDLLPADIFPFDEELECDYKGEHYSVRDNGAIMRHAKGRKRPLDEVWTFGEKDVANGSENLRWLTKLENILLNENTIEPQTVKDLKF